MNFTKMKKEGDTIYKLKVLTITFIMATLIGCNGNGTKQLPNESQTQVTEKYFKTLLVIGDDRSGSTSDIRKLTEDNYRSLISAVGEKGGGTVAICLIGNPKPQSREPYILELTSLENLTYYDPKDPNLTLSQKGAIKAKNDKIISENQRIVATMSNKIDKFINSYIKPNLIDYHPSGPDQTDLDDAISRINTIINESHYQSYDKIIVALLSDGVNQPSAGIKTISQSLKNTMADLYLVGWQTATSCFEVKKMDKLSVKDALIMNISNLKN